MKCLCEYYGNSPYNYLDGLASGQRVKSEKLIYGCTTMFSWPNQLILLASGTEEEHIALVDLWLSHKANEEAQRNSLKLKGSKFSPSTPQCKHGLCRTLLLTCSQATGRSPRSCQPTSARWSALATLVEPGMRRLSARPVRSNHQRTNPTACRTLTLGALLLGCFPPVNSMRL